jgi:hypothetical protein
MIVPESTTTSMPLVCARLQSSMRPLAAAVDILAVARKSDTEHPCKTIICKKKRHRFGSIGHLSDFLTLSTVCTVCKPGAGHPPTEDDPIAVRHPGMRLLILLVIDGICITEYVDIRFQRCKTRLISLDQDPSLRQFHKE